MYMFNILPAFLALTSLAFAEPHHHKNGKSGNCELTEASSHAVTNNYLHIWNTGDFSTVSQVVSPSIHYYQDRLPTGTGNGSIEFPISNSSTWEFFVTRARQGWMSYTFTVLYQFYQKNQIAVRWRSDATSNHTGPPREIAFGTTVSFNGTDLIIVDCHGLIVEVDSCQDYMQDYHNLQLPLGNV